MARANNKSAWEYRYTDPETGKDKSMYFSTEQFSTQTAVERHLESFVLKINSDNPQRAVQAPTFAALLDRFIRKNAFLRSRTFAPDSPATNSENLAFQPPVPT